MLTLGLIALSVSTPDMAAHGRHLSWTSILAYAPGSKVTDHANIDLDQAALETALKAVPQASAYSNAKAIYTNGAHSKPAAVCTLTSGLAAAVKKSDAVTFLTNNGETTTGKSTGSFAAADKSLTFTYPVSEDRVQPATTACYVGGLPSASHKTAGCIQGSNAYEAGSGPGTGSSTLTVGGISYLATCVNKGKRTLQGFSTGAEGKMYTCTVPAKSYPTGCPYTTYAPYYDYYGDFNYADTLILAALDGTKADFTNFAQDFSTGTPNTDDPRVEVAKKATSYMNAGMYVLREFEDAIDDCAVGDITLNAGSSGPVHAWDEGVAFYTGSLMDSDMLTGANLNVLDDEGKMPYTLANKRCKNYKTCGPDKNEKVGQAHANIKLFDLFSAGQHKLLTGECAAVVPIKDAIATQMTIPLIQGTLRYAYKVAKLSAGSKAKGEGTVFAAAVLPLVHKHNVAAAKTIADNMGISSATVDFAAVLAAFESVYVNLGISCSDIGCLMNGDKCYDGFPVCSNSLDSAGAGLDSGALAGIVAAVVVAVLLLLCLCRMVQQEKKGKPLFTPMGPGK